MYSEVLWGSKSKPQLRRISLARTHTGELFGSLATMLAQDQPPDYLLYLIGVLKGMRAVSTGTVRSGKASPPPLLPPPPQQLSAINSAAGATDGDPGANAPAVMPQTQQLILDSDSDGDDDERDGDGDPNTDVDEEADPAPQATARLAASGVGATMVAAGDSRLTAASAASTAGTPMLSQMLPVSPPKVRTKSALSARCPVGSVVPARGISRPALPPGRLLAGRLTALSALSSPFNYIYVSSRDGKRHRGDFFLDFWIFGFFSSHVVLTSMPPTTRRVTCPTWCPC